MHSRISAQNQYKDRFNKWLYSAGQTATTAHINHATQKIDSSLVLMAIKSVILGERAGNRGPARWQHFLPFHIRALQCECYKTCTYINFENFILIDTINFNHNLGPLKLKDLAKKVLNKDQSKKKPKNYNSIIKKIFLQLYINLENKVNKKN